MAQFGTKWIDAHCKGHRVDLPNGDHCFVRMFDVDDVIAVQDIDTKGLSASASIGEQLALVLANEDGSRMYQPGDREAIEKLARTPYRIAEPIITAAEALNGLAEDLEGNSRRGRSSATSSGSGARAAGRTLKRSRKS